MAKTQLSYEQIKGNVVSVKDYGAVGDGVTDNTAAYDALIAATTEGTKIYWPKGTYIGNFKSDSKAFELDLGGSTLKGLASSTTVPAIRFGPQSFNSYTVTESTLDFGDRVFNLSGDLSGIDVGDIGYLHDGAIRPTGGSVNYATVKVAAKSGTQITVEGFIPSYFGASTITFSHSTTQPKNVKIYNGNVEMDSSHTNLAIYPRGCEGVVVENINVSSWYADAVSVRYCYDVNVNNIKCTDPIATGSGQGYGVALLGVSHFDISDLYGEGTRHIFDADSSYFGKVSKVDEIDDQGSPVIFAHNGFAGFIDIETVNVRTAQYPVSGSEQGYGGSPSAEKGKHPFRSINVKNVNATIKSSIDPDDFNVAGVYYQNSTVDCYVNNIRTRYEDKTTSTTPISVQNSVVVRVDGSMYNSSFENISCEDQIGNVFFSNGNKGTLSSDGQYARFRGLSAQGCNRLLFTQGQSHLDIDGCFVTEDGVGTELIKCETAYTVAPLKILIGDNIEVEGSVKPILTSDGSPTGKTPLTYRSSGSGVALSTGSAAISLQDIQNRTGLLQATPEVGSGALACTLPAPALYAGERVKIRVPDDTSSGRKHLTFAADANLTNAFTAGNGGEDIAELVSVTGKWQCIGVSRVS